MFGRKIDVTAVTIGGMLAPQQEPQRAPARQEEQGEEGFRPMGIVIDPASLYLPAGPMDTGRLVFKADPGTAERLQMFGRLRLRQRETGSNDHVWELTCSSLVNFGELAGRLVQQMQQNHAWLSYDGRLVLHQLRTWQREQRQAAQRQLDLSAREAELRQLKAERDYAEQVLDLRREAAQVRAETRALLEDGDGAPLRIDAAELPGHLMFATFAGEDNTAVLPLAWPAQPKREKQPAE